jgi:hypothetical protein
MGTGCQSVRCTTRDDVDVAVGTWSDGRIGTVRGMRAGPYAFGFTAFCEKQVVPVTIDGRYYYRELLKVIVDMLQSGRWPLLPNELVEPVAFQEAALLSARGGGQDVRLDSL